MSKQGSQGPRSIEGSKRDVMGYQEPVIPGWSPYKSMGPGLGGANCGKAGSQGGNISCDGADGAVGIKRSGGEGQGMGTNRKG